MQVALFGAAFDPPHLGHLAVLTAVLRQGLADEVWLVPAKSHPFGKQLSHPKHRLAMLELLVASLTDPSNNSSDLIQKIRIELFELENPVISYTYITLTELSRRYPEHIFSFVMGSDNLARFNEWGGQEVLAKYPFWIYPRAGYPLEPLLPNMQVIQNVSEIDISSTLVRKNISQNLSIQKLVPANIISYIDSYQLYK